MIHNKFYFRILALVCLFGLFACEKQEAEPGVIEVSMAVPSVDYNAGSVFVKVKASGDWTLALKPYQGTEVWGSISPESGSGDKSNVVLTYSENDTEESRYMTIVLEAFGGQRVDECIIEQTPYSSGGGNTVTPMEIQSDPVPLWLELPKMSEEENLYFLTHYQTLPGNNKQIRSWSCWYDTDALVSHWVAYPMNATTIGSGSRTNKWGLDPKVPRSKQPVLYSGFKSNDGVQYDRGHQLPSADLLNYEANVTTFYGTNMTPQLGQLNQNVWANLEGKVRDWARSFDTLYVVTGCTVDGSTKVAFDNEGKEVIIPTAYYKALLGYKKNGTLGITGSTGGYTAIGFYFRHEACSGSYMDKAMTIDELEEIVGEDFFFSLSSGIGQAMADRVESTDDTWWYN